MTATVLGLEPTLGQEAHAAPFWTREMFCAALGVLGLVCVRRLAHPGVRLGLAPLALGVPVAVMWLLAVIALARAAPGDRSALIWGETALVCPPLIAMVSARSPTSVLVPWALM